MSFHLAEFRKGLAIRSALTDIEKWNKCRGCLNYNLRIAALDQHGDEICKLAKGIGRYPKFRAMLKTFDPDTVNELIRAERRTYGLDDFVTPTVTVRSDEQ